MYAYVCMCLGSGCLKQQQVAVRGDVGWAAGMCIRHILGLCAVSGGGCVCVCVAMFEMLLKDANLLQHRVLRNQPLSSLSGSGLCQHTRLGSYFKSTGLCSHNLVVNACHLATLMFVLWCVGFGGKKGVRGMRW